MNTKLNKMDPSLTKIVIVDDEPMIREEITDALQIEGYEVLNAKSIQDFREVVEDDSVDLFLVDLGLPDGSGLSLVKEIRETASAGIIIISGKNSEIDKVVGLEVGADDYVTKPFSARELTARISSVLRRTILAEPAVKSKEFNATRCLTINGWKIGLFNRSVRDDNGRDVHLTKAEFELLKVFVENQDRVLTRDNLINLVRGRDWAGYDRAVDGLVSRLRKKLRSKDSVSIDIKTIYGIGYMVSGSETH